MRQQMVWGYAHAQYACQRLSEIEHISSGIMLGPIRFTHIENVARSALARFRQAEQAAAEAQQAEELLRQVKELDQRITELSKDLGLSPQKEADYKNMNVQKGQRLLAARQKRISLLEAKMPKGPTDEGKD
jgi:hypothetical protein